MPLKRYPAELEYEKDSKLSRAVVKDITTWVQTQPHLPAVEEEDVILFLSSCNYSTEVAKQTIDLNYTYRTHVPELFSNRDPSDDNAAFKTCVGTYIPLPGITKDGHKALYITMHAPDLSKLICTNECKTLAFVIDNMLYEEGAHEGWRVIYDMEGSSLGAMTQISPIMMKKMFSYNKEAAPVRLKKVHIIKPTFYADTFVNILRPFLNKSVDELVEVHTSLEEFHKHIPKEMLPSDAEGALQPTGTLFDEYKKRIAANREFFIAEGKLRVDETKRPGEARSASDIFGIEGSFRSLEID